MGISTLCGSTNNSSKGTRRVKDGLHRIRRCKSCGRKFTPRHQKPRDEADAYLCERTLRNYRRMIIAHNLDQVLFRHLTNELIRAFGVKTTKQRIDSTSIRSANLYNCLAGPHDHRNRSDGKS